MLKSFSGNIRNWSPTQLILGSLGLLLVLLLIIGSISQAIAPDPNFSILPTDKSFVLLAVLAFAGGLLSFVSPCTLPILPAYFAFAFQSGRKQIAANTVVFMLGVATMFSLLGAATSTIGLFFRRSQDLILLIGGAVVLVFGIMSLLGKGFTGVQQDESETIRSTSLGGSYAFGLTFAVGWSSCVGPILGAVLTLAGANSASFSGEGNIVGAIISGGILLFIYALGLGLPLMVVSTFFGRVSRKSLFWRILRGKGWHVATHSLIVAIIWALVIWQIAVALVKFLFFNDFETFDQFTPLHNYGLLALALAGAILWVFTKPGSKKTTLELHSTQLVSGALFALMGILMLTGSFAVINQLASADVGIFAELEEWLLGLFGP